ncbi:hypothetical protein AX774_g3375 [Zancudomyces culisetae]|uniref:Vps72/YL1 N-terminal domain-containing protein n=1 Tax=Zancudomyces culisetae TaxID=1213189 RepID=A0A1R1PQE1_ZANCU|nr:hypothetical protein AX774_g7727 [Zancudomyces culisetae]OMH83123.1 hypothetical protein AX774_g3375 [Zancudomyces culisetae]|eukprot:OMH78877.1 hypothetical protein AX774_g7727 [Zancudomyces culisetae]
MNRRERRANAGAKLQSLIQKEIEKKGEKAFGDDQEEKEYKYLSEEYEEEGQQDITDSDFEETDSEDEFEDEEMSQRLEEIIRQAEKAKVSPSLLFMFVLGQLIR